MPPNVNVNLSRPSHRGLGPLLSTNIVWFLSPQNMLYVQGLLDGECHFSFLSEKTTNKSNRLQMALQRQNFLPSYLRPRVLVWPGFETAQQTVVFPIKPFALKIMDKSHQNKS